jgi:hypothetical protein
VNTTTNRLLGAGARGAATPQEIEVDVDPELVAGAVATIESEATGLPVDPLLDSGSYMR